MRLLAVTTATAVWTAGVLGQDMPEGDEFTVVHADLPAKKGQPPPESVCWLPKGCANVRGVVVGHPMIEALATEARFRRVAAEEGLGTMLIRGFTWDTAKNWQTLDSVLEKWAEASKHPELKGAPVLVSGLSASVLMARLLVYERPERCFGIIHVAGGNMQEAYPEGKTLSGVPFMAVNGEYESCGPAGGIRPHLGFDTQWYLMGEQMLERRRQDPNHLMCMVTIPCRGHTAWSKQLAELFIRKAAQYRLPKEKRDGSSPAKCAVIKAEDGWLTDRDVKYPKHEAAPYNEYKGDKGQAFWHLDKEMALAVNQYHKDGIRSGQGRSLFRPSGLFQILWPLGEKLDVTFDEKATAPEGYETTLRGWIGGKAKGLSAEAIAALARGMAEGVKRDAATGAVDERTFRDHCQRVCFAYDDHYRPVEDAIEKAMIPAECKKALRALYAKEFLDDWPSGRVIPALPVRITAALVSALPPRPFSADAAVAEVTNGERVLAAVKQVYGVTLEPKPEGLDKQVEDLKHKDSKVGWAAADELAKLGAPAIPHLVRLMDFEKQPVNFRAAGALGRMGKAAACALPDLRRASLRAGASEMEATLSPTALEAIELIEKAEAPR
jgi:hypothetical protein